MIIILVSIPLFYSYKRNFYKYENKILQSGFVELIDNQNNFFKWSIKTYQREVEDVKIIFKEDHSVVTRGLSYLLFNSENEIVNEKYFTFLDINQN
jgi:hypothetical protein